IMFHIYIYIYIHNTHAFTHTRACFMHGVLHNKYHFTPEAVGTLGVPMHTDLWFFNILQDDENVGGLQAMSNKSVDFIPIDPLPGTFVVNFGDAGHVWSNGRGSAM